MYLYILLLTATSSNDFWLFLSTADALLVMMKRPSRVVVWWLIVFIVVLLCVNWLCCGCFFSIFFLKHLLLLRPLTLYVFMSKLGPLRWNSYLFDRIPLFLKLMKVYVHILASQAGRSRKRKLYHDTRSVSILTLTSEKMNKNIRMRAPLTISILPNKTTISRISDRDEKDTLYSTLWSRMHGQKQ